MGARQRLNSLYLLGALIIAALIGRTAESWSVFVLAAALLIGMLVHAGDIRPSPAQRRRRRGR